MADYKGAESLWNEATFKSARLNSVQEVLNDLRLEPLGVTSNGKFSYELIFSTLNVLYHEGYSKYSTAERREVDHYMNAIEEIIRTKPPAKMIIKDQIAGKSSQIQVSNEKLNALLFLLREFERKIKHYNDKHGLTTSNKEHSGLF